MARSSCPVPQAARESSISNLGQSLSWPIKASSHGPTCGFPVFVVARANVSSDDARRRETKEEARGFLCHQHFWPGRERHQHDHHLLHCDAVAGPSQLAEAATPARRASGRSTAFVRGRGERRRLLVSMTKLGGNCCCGGRI